MERQPEDEEWRQTTSVIAEAVVYGRGKDKEQIIEFLLKHVWVHLLLLKYWEVFWALKARNINGFL
jgi:hypothetical protein